MQILKDGSIKYKASALKAAEWYQQRPLPMRSMKKGTQVRVFMGAGWDSGTVVQWSADGITVWLPRRAKTVNVRDNRNLKLKEDK